LTNSSRLPAADPLEVTPPERQHADTKEPLPNRLTPAPESPAGFVEAELIVDPPEAADAWWYCSPGGTERGPVSFELLKSMARHQQLVPGDFVWREGQAGWTPALSIADLFPPANRQGVDATGARPLTSPMATASFVLGLMGILQLLPLVGCILGIVLGHLACSRIDSSRGTLRGRKLAVMGLVLGYCGFGVILIASAAALAWYLATGSLGGR
jgi:hypothetical protein